MSSDYEILDTEGKGRGLFAARRFVVGERVVAATVVERPVPNGVHATQVGRFEWALLDEAARTVNHSCDPNCGVRVDSAGIPDLVAMRTIFPGQEITFDYAMRNYT